MCFLQLRLASSLSRMKLTEWLETRWVTPAYSGWLLAGLALCFFGAATNK